MTNLTRAQKIEYINQASVYIVPFHNLLGLCASARLAQSALEPAYGTSDIFKATRNMFGLKGKSEYGTVSYRKVTEIINGKTVKIPSNFRYYPELKEGVLVSKESIIDQGLYLCGKRYNEFRCAKNYVSACCGLATKKYYVKGVLMYSARYATDPYYADKLISLIREQGLDRFDTFGKHVNVFMPLRKGDKESKRDFDGPIHRLQRKLGIIVDGDFGYKTHLAVKAFQRKNRLKVDGVVGINTYIKLYDIKFIFKEKASSMSEFEKPANETGPVISIEPEKPIESEKQIEVKPNEPRAHFSLSEFKCRNGVRVPSRYKKNAEYLIARLEELRAYIGAKPIHIRSAYRTRSYNKAIGGAGNSQHLYACAADIYVRGMTAKQLAIKVLELFEPEYLKKQDDKYLKQLGIGLGGNSIVHIDFGVACGTRKRPADWFYDKSGNISEWMDKSRWSK